MAQPATIGAKALNVSPKNFVKAFISVVNKPANATSPAKTKGNARTYKIIFNI